MKILIISVLLFFSCGYSVVKKNINSLPDVIATTKRIQAAENIIEWQNKQNLKQAKIINNQKIFAKRALIIINRAVKIDSLSAALAEKYGWLKKGENK